MPTIIDADPHDPCAVADEAMQDAEAVAVLRGVASMPGLPEHRRRLIAAVAAAIDVGELADSTGCRAAVVEHRQIPLLFPDNDDGHARRPT